MVCPLRSRFKYLSTIEMKEMLQDRMFHVRQHTGHEAHVRLYEALETSILQENAYLHYKEMESQRKKKNKQPGHPKPPSVHPRQPPPPPPPSGPSGPSGATKQSSASALKSVATPTSSSTQQDTTDKTKKSPSSKQAKHVAYDAWTTIDTGATLVEYYIQHSHAVNEEYVAPDPSVSSDDEEDDASTSHIPRKEKWWKSHAREDDTPSVTLSKDELQQCLKPDESLPADEPIWSLPSTNQQAIDNNWAKAITNSFEPPVEDSLLAQTWDMGTFIQWFCKHQGLSELTQKDLEGPAFSIVKAFHSNVTQLQY